MEVNLELLALWALHLLLTGLPAAAAALLAARAGLRSVPLLLSAALAGSGGTAILCFWLFYADPTIGETASFFFVFASAGAIFWCWRQGIERSVLRGLATPFALWGLAAAFVLFLGFIHGGNSEPLVTASIRFSHQLPSDNDIPRFFADYFYFHGHQGTPPPFGDWLSSDRPPLQVGYVLSQRPFGWDDSGLHYEVLGVIVQQLWILGLWALLCAARLTPRTRGLVAFAAIVSDVAIVHAFFVWPKLIAASFLLAALALVLSEDWPRLRQRPWAGALFAALCALAFLAHGSSAFFIVPLLVAAIWRGVPSWSWVAVGIAVGIVLLAPWSAYQRYGDPPGDRLIKWQLGGSLEIDERGALETIVDSYREAGPGGTAENKRGNLTQMVGAGDVDRAVDGAVDQIGEGNPGKAVIALRVPRFYDLLPFLGLLLLGPLAMAVAWLRGRRPRDPDWTFAVFGIAFSAIACLVWALLMFGGPDSKAVIHQGSLAVPLMALCSCVAGACAVDRRFGLGLVLANVALVLLLYVPAVGPVPGTSYSIAATFLAALALTGVAFLTLRPLLRA
ncbi:MAG: hypothetical protein E6G51_02115 [Actinobacteria bacterium]|nr:MAG: hypothetical protein E6G51_02115 [Actinomycetota bacterium]